MTREEFEAHPHVEMLKHAMILPSECRRHPTNPDPAAILMTASAALRLSRAMHKLGALQPDQDAVRETLREIDHHLVRALRNGQIEES